MRLVAQIPVPKLYNLRHRGRTLLYQTIAEHAETWLGLDSAGQFDGQGDLGGPKVNVRHAFAEYPQCGNSAQGFARARDGEFEHDYFEAFDIRMCGGGFQVWSLRDMRKISEEGMRFASPVNGDKLLLTP